MNGTQTLILILGGVALLLWGARMIRTGVMRSFSADLHRFVGTWSVNRMRALLAGTVIGTALQSSTATTMLVSPFVAQGVVPTVAALAMMLGADLGSAIAASLFSSGIANAWPVLALAGYVVHTVNQSLNSRTKNAGRIMIGLGLLFLGLQTISQTSATLSSSPTLLAVIQSAASEPLLAILAGAALTWLAYSSIAIILLIVALASHIGLPAELLYPLVLGVNAGATLPAFSATLAEEPATRRIPLGNMMFRICGVVIALPLLGFVAPYIALISEVPSQKIIIFHVAFNIALTVGFVGLTTPIAKLAKRILPDPPTGEKRTGPQYLDKRLFETPGAALGAATRETLRMGDAIENMLARTITVFESNDETNRKAVARIDDEVDELNEAIKLYLTKLMREELDDADSQRAVDIITYTTNLEHVGDIIDKNLMELAEKKRRHSMHFSQAGMRDIVAMHTRVMDTLHLSLNVFINADTKNARELLRRKQELRTLEIDNTQRHIQRLQDGLAESVVSSAIHLDVVRDLKRINSHLTSVAYPVLERAGELRQTRMVEQTRDEGGRA